MTSNVEWENYHDDQNSRTVRLKVEGGYLYKHERFFKASIDSSDRNFVQDFYIVFVPDPPKTKCQVGNHNYRIFMNEGICLDCGKEYVPKGGICNAAV